jgi:spore maturation protein CgeB
VKKNLEIWNEENAHELQNALVLWAIRGKAIKKNKKKLQFSILKTVISQREFSHQLIATKTITKGYGLV